MIQSKGLTFMVKRGSAARLIAAIALATFGCANYVQAVDCNQTYDDMPVDRMGCHMEGEFMVQSTFSPSTYRQCRSSYLLPTGQSCSMLLATFSQTDTWYWEFNCSENALWTSDPSPYYRTTAVFATC